MSEYSYKSADTSTSTIFDSINVKPANQQATTEAKKAKNATRRAKEGPAYLYIRRLIESNEVVLASEYMADLQAEVYPQHQVPQRPDRTRFYSSMLLPMQNRV